MKDKHLLGGLILLLAVAGLFFLGRRLYYEHIYYPAKIEETNQRRAEQLQEYRNDSNDMNEIIFLGNSLTAFYDLAKWYPNHKIKNRGIGGDTTKDILDRLDEVTESQPTQIFLMIGINDIGTGLTDEELQANYKIIVKRIMAESPQTELHLLSLLPIASYWDYSYKMNRRIMMMNAFVKALAEQYNLVYIDLFSSFLEIDGLKEEFTNDGVHLTEPAYKVWTEIVSPYVKPTAQ